MKNIIVVFGFLMATVLFACKGSSSAIGSVSESNKSVNTTGDYKNVETIKTPQTIEQQGTNGQAQPQPTMVPASQFKNTSIKKDVPASK